VLGFFYQATPAFAVRNFDASNAKLMWREPVGCQFWGRGCWNPVYQGTDSSPAIHDGVITIGSYDGTLHTLDLTNGTALKSLETTPGTSDPSGGYNSPKITPSGHVVGYGGLLSKTVFIADVQGEEGTSWELPCANDGWVVSTGISNDGATAFVGTTKNKGSSTGGTV
jgi:hypothetical protein